jgi:type IV secretory pathway ATPase VirB11/archaellum biosynthesis ATPase
MNPDRILMTEVRGAEAWIFSRLKFRPCREPTTVHESTLKMLCLGWFSGVI